MSREQQAAAPAPGADRESTLAGRVGELELKLLDAEDGLEQLNRTVYRQQQELDRLQRELVMLRQQLASLPSGEFRSLRDEIPPHY